MRFSPGERRSVSKATLLLQPLSQRAARHPLETIACCLLVASTCYFSLVHFLPRPVFTDGIALLHSKVIGLRDGHFAILDADAPPAEHTILLKQIVINAPKANRQPEGVLTKSVLRTALSLQSAMEQSEVLDGSASGSVSLQNFCYRQMRPPGNASASACYVLSPLALWANDRRVLDNDSDISKTVSNGVNTLSSSQFMGLDNYFREISSDKKSPSVILGASSMVITYLLDISTPAGAHAARNWEQKISNIKLENLGKDYVTSNYNHEFMSDTVLKLKEFWEVRFAIFCYSLFCSSPHVLEHILTYLVDVGKFGYRCVWYWLLAYARNLHCSLLEHANPRLKVHVGYADQINFKFALLLF